MTLATAPTAAQWFLGILDAIGSGPPGANIRQCPAHEDGAPSLSVGRGEDGKALIRCHAGCTWRQILDSLSLPGKYLTNPPPVAPTDYAAAFITPRKFPPVVRKGGRSLRESGYRLEAIHEYGPNYQVLRWRKGAKKEMVWESRNPAGEMVPGLLGTPTSALPIYLERDIVAAVAMGDRVVICESESSADALVKAGVLATTWAGGATAVQVPALRKVLADYPHIVVIPDHDEPGLAALDTLRSAGLAPHVVLGEPGEDARDILARVGPDQLRTVIDQA